jgi:hypothetical protein
MQRKEKTSTNMKTLGKLEATAKLTVDRLHLKVMHEVHPSIYGWFLWLESNTRLMR